MLEKVANAGRLGELCSAFVAATNEPHSPESARIVIDEAHCISVCDFLFVVICPRLNQLVYKGMGS